MALGTQTQGKLLDYEQFIDHQLARTQAKIKSTDILIACLTLATACLGVLFLEVMLDHAVGLPIWARRVILYSGLVAAATYTGFKIARPFLRRVNGFYAAKTIEGIDPAFKNSLISYLDLRKYRDQIPKRALRAIEAKAVGDLTRIEIDSVVNQKGVLHTWYALMGVIMVIFVYYGFAPKSVMDSVKRAFIADVVRPTNTRLDFIKPGDDPELMQVVAGSRVPFSVETRGVRPDKVMLHYSTDGGNFYLLQEFAPGTNLYDPWQTQIQNVQQGLDYFITGGDAESRHYKVKVLPAPMVTSVTLDYNFPTYTGVAPRIGVEGGAVDAIEGTDITVHAKTNQPAKVGNIDLGKEKVHRMEVGSEDPQQLTGRFRVESDGSYTIKFQNTGGQMNPDPVVYDIHAIKDLVPTVKFIAPEPRIKAPSNGKVVLKIEAGDDYGVKALNLNVYQGSEGLVSRDLLDNKPPTRKFAGTEILDLGAIPGLKPGTNIEYWLVVRDTKEPSSNSAKTEKQIIEVIEPLKPEQLARQDEQIQKDNPQQAAPEEGTKGKEEGVKLAGNNNEEPRQGKDLNDQGQGGKPDPTALAQNDTQRPAADPQDQKAKPQTPEEKKKMEDLLQRLKNIEQANQQDPQQNQGDNNNQGQPGVNQNQPNPNQAKQPQPGDNTNNPRQNEVAKAGSNNNTPPQPSNPNATQPNGGGQQQQQQQNGPKRQTDVSSPSPNQPNGNQTGQPQPNDNNALPETSKPLPDQPNGDPQKNQPNGTSQPNGTNSPPNNGAKQPPNGSNKPPQPGTPNPATGQPNPPQQPGPDSQDPTKQQDQNTSGATNPPGTQGANQPTANKTETKKSNDPGQSGAKGSNQPQTGTKPTDGSTQKADQLNKPENNPSNPGTPGVQPTNPNDPKAEKLIDPKTKPENGAANQNGTNGNPGLTKNEAGKNQVGKPDPSKANNAATKGANSPTGNNTNNKPAGNDPKNPQDQANTQPDKNTNAGANNPANKPPTPDSATNKPNDPPPNPAGADPKNPQAGQPNTGPKDKDANKPNDAKNEGANNATPGDPKGTPPESKPGESNKNEGANKSNGPGQPNGEAKPNDSKPNGNGPGQPNEANKPNGPGQPGESNKPGEPNKSDDTKPNAPGQPNGENKPNGPGQPNNETKPNGPGQPNNETKPNGPGQPNSGKPGESSKTNEAKPTDTKPNGPGQPNGENKPNGPGQPSGTKPNGPGQPNGENKPTPGNPNGETPKGETQKGGAPNADQKDQGTPKPGQPDGTPPGGEKPKDGANPPGDATSSKSETNPSGTKPDINNKPGDPSGNAGKPNPDKPAPGASNDPKSDGTKNTTGQPEANKPSTPDSSAPGQPDANKPQAPGQPDTKPNTPPNGTPKPSDDQGTPDSKTPSGAKPDQNQPKSDQSNTPPTSQPNGEQSKENPTGDNQPKPEQPQANSPQGQKPQGNQPAGSQPQDAKPKSANSSNTPPKAQGNQGANKPPAGQQGQPQNAPGQTGEGQAKGNQGKGGQGQGNDPQSQGNEGKGPGKGKEGEGNTPDPNKPGKQPGGKNESPEGTPGKEPGNGPPSGVKPGQGQPGGDPSNPNAPGGSQPGSGTPKGSQPGSGTPKGGNTPSTQPGNKAPGTPKGSGEPGKGDSPQTGGNQQGGKNPDQANDPGQKPADDPQDQDGQGTPNGIPTGRGPKDAANANPNKGEDKSQPLPPVENRSSDGADPSIAPDNQPPLVIRKLQDLLKEDKFTPNVEKQLGMTKDEAEQFVKKYEKPKVTPPVGPGREIKVKPGEEKVIDPSRKSDFNTTATASKRSERQGSTIPQDKISGLSEGMKSSPPPELRRQYEAYKKGLSNSKVVAPTVPSTPPGK